MASQRSVPLIFFKWHLRSRIRIHKPIRALNPHNLHQDPRYSASIIILIQGRDLGFNTVVGDPTPRVSFIGVDDVEGDVEREYLVV